MLRVWFVFTTLHPQKMEIPMSRSFRASAIMIAALMVASAGWAGAQQTSQPDPYQGTSNPPPDDTIITSQPPAEVPAAKPKPSAYGRPADGQPAPPAAA